MHTRIFYALIGCFILSSCNQNTVLPVYGPKTVMVKVENGKNVVDSVDYTLPSFTFVDQDNHVVDSSTVKGKIYVADFFFTSCPSICPRMMLEMDSVYNKYLGNPDVVILSYSIDPVRDSVTRLKSYERKLGFSSKQWHLLTGEKDSIYHLAEKYLVSAAEDPDAPGGHIHSGNFILVDRKNRIRGYYDGTKDDGRDKLLGDMDELLKEK